MASRPVTYIPPDFNVNSLPLVSFGASGSVFKVSDQVVIKKPLALGNCLDQVEVERKIYQRLGCHPNITRCLGSYHGMLLLERLQYPLRKRLLDLRSQGQAPATKVVVRWALQIARGLEHAHTHNVFQVDIGAGNILLDWDDAAKLSDFAGSSIDGCAPTVLPSTHSEHPRWPAKNPSVQLELFALGSTLFEIETTTKPYNDKDDSQVVDLFRHNVFPSTDNMVLGPIIQRCWLAGYGDMAGVVRDAQQLFDGQDMSEFSGSRVAETK